MAENNSPGERETKDVLDVGEYHPNDDNNAYGIRIAPVVSAGQKSTPSIRTGNDLNFDIESAYSITVTRESESSTVGCSTYTSENYISASIGGHELLVDRSPQEQHDYKQQVIDKLKKENIELKQKKMCVICGNKDFEFVFQPCGHLVCDECSELGICICSAHVTSKHVCILSRKVTSLH